jgi:hypothetical protein
MGILSYRTTTDVVPYHIASIEIQQLIRHPPFSDPCSLSDHVELSLP